MPRRGLTLVELLVTTAILAMAATLFIGGLHSSSSAATLSSATTDVTHAISLARSSARNGSATWLLYDSDNHALRVVDASDNSTRWTQHLHEEVRFELVRNGNRAVDLRFDTRGVSDDAEFTIESSYGSTVIALSGLTGHLTRSAEVHP